MAELLERLKKALEGRYDVEREIGRGGMATVFLALELQVAALLDAAQGRT